MPIMVGLSLEKAFKIFSLTIQRRTNMITLYVSIGVVIGVVLYAGFYYAMSLAD